jgi:adenylate cyclase
MEIERKFLVVGAPWQAGEPGTSIRQGYLSHGDQTTVRVRVTDRAAWITIKGPTQSLSREEYEYEIPLEDGIGLLALVDDGVVEKVRHVVVHDGDRWEIDVFTGANRGLVVAEIELECEEQSFASPEWLGEEVSHDSRYRNSSLSRAPYTTW